MKIIYEEGDACPICKNKLIIYINEDEDESTYLQCPENKQHYSKYLGMNDDLNN